MQRYLAGRPWPYEDNGDYLTTLATGSTDTWPVYFDAREDDQHLLVYSLIPFTVPPDRRTAAAIFLTRANHGLPIGNFELDLDNGEVRCKTSVDVEGASLEDALIDHLLVANIVTVDRYVAALRRVVGGADAAAMAAEADQTGAT